MTTDRANPLLSGKETKSAGRSRRGPGRPTREVIEQRNEELLDQSLELFLENGFEATTIEAISSAIGMSRRTIYSRYGDKHTLFKAALQRAVDDWVVPREQLEAAERDDLEETLVSVASLWVANVKKPSGWRLVRIANTEVFRRPEVAEYLYNETAKPTIRYLRDLFQRRLRPGQEVPDALDAALSFLILVVEGSIQLVVWGQMPEEDFDRQIAYRVRLFLRGAVVPPA